MKDESDDQYLVLPQNSDLTSVRQLLEKVKLQTDRPKEETQQRTTVLPAVPFHTAKSPQGQQTAETKWPKWTFPLLPQHIQASQNNSDIICYYPDSIMHIIYDSC